MELITSEQIGNEIQLLSNERKKELQYNFQKLAGEGKRVLAFAYKNLVKKEEEYTLSEAESDLVFV